MYQCTHVETCRRRCTLLPPPPPPGLLEKLCFTLCPRRTTWARHIKVLICPWHRDTASSYQVGQKSAPPRPAVPLVSEVSADGPRSSSSSVKEAIWAGEGVGGLVGGRRPARLLIKVMSCKMGKEGSGGSGGGDRRLLPATLSLIPSAGSRTPPLYLPPPVTVNEFVYVYEHKAVRPWGREAALPRLRSHHILHPSLLVDCRTQTAPTLLGSGFPTTFSKWCFNLQIKF